MNNIVEATLLALQGKLEEAENKNTVNKVAEIEQRTKNLKMMDQVARRVNDEEIFEYWLMAGIPDGAHDDEFPEWASNLEDYNEFEEAFKKVLKAAREEDGLYDASEEELAFARKYEPEIQNIPPVKIESKEEPAENKPEQEKVEESAVIETDEDYNEIAQEYKDAYHKDLDMQTVPCVIARDKMLSGWGGAEGKSHYQVVLCGNSDEAYNIEHSMQSKANSEQLANIRRTTGVKLSPRASVSYVVGRNARAWNTLSDGWYSDRFEPKEPEEERVEETVERRCLGQKVEEAVEKKTESVNGGFVDYIILKDYDSDNWSKVLLFDHYLTAGDIERMKQVINEVKTTVEDYDNEVIEEAIDEVVPFIDTITVYGDDKALYF